MYWLFISISPFVNCLWSANLTGCKKYTKVLVWIFSKIFNSIWTKNKIAESIAKFHKFLKIHFRMLFTPKQGGTSLGKKSQDLLFSVNGFCSLSVCDSLRLTPKVFRSEIFTRHSSLYLLSFGWSLSPRFVPQDWQ